MQNGAIGALKKTHNTMDFEALYTLVSPDFASTTGVLFSDMIGFSTSTLLMLTHSIWSVPVHGTMYVAGFLAFAGIIAFAFRFLTMGEKLV